MAELEGVISKAFSRYLTGWALSKAILEDYARVVSKIENVPEQEVYDRVWNRCDVLFKEAKEKQIKDTEEAKKQE